MIVEMYPYPYYSDNLKQNEPLHYFISNTFKSFQKEFDLMASNLFMEPKKLEEQAFSLVESSYIGLMNGAMVKYFGDELTCLQEFTTLDNKEAKTRADFMVRLLYPKSPIDVLFEVNPKEECKENLMLDFGFKNETEQVRNYYKDTRANYVKKSYAVPICFGLLGNSEMVKEAIKNYPKGFKEKNPLTDFCVIYHNNRKSKGIWIYGKINSPQGAISY
ncbi:MAG: hypothetical protein SGJ10_03630 [Bacteroidota bacterium]|nr:hypothetical protein [Bacteroidota bacterium]